MGTQDSAASDYEEDEDQVAWVDSDDEIVKRKGAKKKTKKQEKAESKPSQKRAWEV